MVSFQDIHSLAVVIARRFEPNRITLFGSYAYGIPDENSDVDLLIMMEGRRVHDRAIQIRQAIDFTFPVDLIVRSPSELEQRIRLGDFFLREIQEKGKVLYDAANARVGQKSGRGFHHGTARGAGQKIAQLR